MVLLLAGCSSDPTNAAGAPATPKAPSSASHSAGAQHPSAEASRLPATPLRPGEQLVDLKLPEPYSPQAPTTGTDDYRCFLLDPEIERDMFVTGIDVAPDRAEIVHHVILFRVPPHRVKSALAHDAGEVGQGWTCFGGSGLGGAGGLDDAPWIGAWAPGGGERVLPNDLGIPLQSGSRVVMQVHYNLLAGNGSDQSEARLRLAPGTKQLEPLETILLPAPVELPCRPGVTEPLCDRKAALADVRARFGSLAGQTADFLNLMCSRTGPSREQSCSRIITENATIRAAAGHMHLLGTRIRIEFNPGREGARTVLDVPVWDFDNQGSRPVRKPIKMMPGDELRVTCEHDQALRDVLPAFEGQAERYVLWGEGTTDEMCLGIVLVTRP